MEVSVPSRWNIHLSIGNRISVLHLEWQNTKNLADLHLCHARRDWAYDGNVSLRTHHDRYQRGRVRPWSYPRRARTNQSAAPGSCLMIRLESCALSARTIGIAARLFALDHGGGCRENFERVHAQ